MTKAVLRKGGDSGLLTHTCSGPKAEIAAMRNACQRMLPDAPRGRSSFSAN